jgi:Leucine-rich repeat (LRR) protein
VTTTAATVEQKPDFITIRGTQYATDLVRLSLINEYLTCEDIEPLRHMTNLRELNLMSNQIVDISPLSNLANLRNLVLLNNQISDLSPLSGLTELEELDLGENEISDISALSVITNLRRLLLYRNHIDDITPLGELINLRHLELSRNKVSDITPLNVLPMLGILTLVENLITDFNLETLLDGFVALQRVDLCYESVSDWSYVSHRRMRQHEQMTQVSLFPYPAVNFT